MNSQIRACQTPGRKARRPDLLSPLVRVHRIPDQSLATAADWREKAYLCVYHTYEWPFDPQSHRLDLLFRHCLHQRNEKNNSEERHAGWAFPHTTLDLRCVLPRTPARKIVSHRIWWKQQNTWARANTSEDARRDKQTQQVLCAHPPTS